MAEFIKLAAGGLKELHRMDERLVSYNVEMTEVTGGTFWTRYTDAQVDGTEEFPMIGDWRDMGKLQQWYEPIDLYNPRLRKLAKDLGTAWVRVSGTWANKTYYDLEGKYTDGTIPEGFQNLLTREQWIGVLEFVKHIGGKLLISATNCPGVHAANEPYPLDMVAKLFAFSAEYGVPIAAAEFTNEPNMMAMSGLPVGYTAADHARDHDIFGAWLKENYPDCLFVGPCTVGDININMGGQNNVGGGIANALQMVTTEELLGDQQVKMDVFSYHYYNGISERGAAMGGHWPVEKCLTDEYLAVAGDCARQYIPRRDKYVPGGQMWVTESGDAGCGGNTWAPTYLDVPRTLNELGDFSTVTDGIIFHNTLASSAYGFLEHGSFEPRPNYFAVLLWNRLMGAAVYETGEPVREGAHVYCHSRKDGKDGCVYLVINNSTTDTTTVTLPGDAVQYVLTGDGKLRSRVMLLNGKPLVLGENDELPCLCGETVAAGDVVLPAGACAFFVL
ncbi:MAG: beta-glucuronidase [Oscillospiraceae bacterium]|nr:beta-glucuronidase [Oscillospiraceae bacterium]